MSQIQEFDDFDTELQVEDRFDDIAEQENAEDWAEMTEDEMRDEFQRFQEYEPSNDHDDEDYFRHMGYADE